VIQFFEHTKENVMNKISKFLILCAIGLTSMAFDMSQAFAQAPFCQFCNSNSQCGQPCITDTGSVSSCGAQQQCDFNNCGVDYNLIFDRSAYFTGNEYWDGGQKFCVMDKLRLGVAWSSCSQSSTGCDALWSFGETWRVGPDEDCNSVGWEDQNQGTYDTYCR
jgi:hypothetical protein